MSIRLRSVLALALLVLFPLVAVAVVGGLLAAAVAVVGTSVPTAAGLPVLLAVPLVVALGGAARQAMATVRAEPQPGPELTRAAHPLLWAELDGLVSAMGLPAPARVVVTPACDAAVAGFGPRAELVIGLPLLAGFDRAQLRAVVAHELGHLAHEHGRSRARVHRAETALEETFEGLEHAPSRLLVGAYRGLYLRAAMPVLREHEYEADVWSARLAGTTAAAAALHRFVLLDVAWDRIGELIGELPDDGPRPSAVDGLEDLLRRHPDELREIATRRHDAATGPWNTHPSGADRVARLRRLAAPGHAAPRHDEPAWALLGDGRAALARLEAELEIVEGTVATWDEAVAAAVLARARSRTELWLDALAAVRPGSPRSAAALLAAVHAGHGPDLVRPALRGDLPAGERPAAVRAVIADLLHATLVTRFCDDGRLGVTADWLDGHDLWVPGPGGQWAAWPLGPAIEAAAADPAAVPALQRAALAAGADLGAAWAAPATPPAALRSAAVAALTVVRPRPRYRGYRRDQAFDLVGYDDGLLLHPVPPRERGMRAGLRHMLRGTHRLHVARVMRLIDEVGGHPAGWAAAAGTPTRWIPYPEIAFTSWQRGLPSGRWRMTPLDGPAITFLGTEFTVRIGDLQAVVERAVAEDPEDLVSPGVAERVHTPLS